MPFQYSDYRGSPAAGSIAELMLRRGEIAAQQANAVANAQARAVETSGNAWAGATAGLGNATARTILEATDPQRKLDAARVQMAQGQIADQNTMRSGQRAMDSMLAGDQLPADATGPRQESYLRSDGLYDITKLSQGLASMGVGHLAPDLLKHAEDLNTSIATAQQHDQQAAQSKAVMLGFMANGALKLHQSVGMPLDGAIDFISQPGLATQQIKPQELAAFKQQIAQLPPEQQVAALQQIKAHAAEIAPTKEHAKDSTTTNVFGEQVGSNVVTDPNKGDYTGPDGIRYHANGTPVTGTVMKPQGAPKSIESKPVLLDGRPALVNFDPATGKHSLPDGTDVSSRVKPVPAASITINERNSQAPNLPAWATDDTRPTGPDANKLDPKIRMTPNGLYQAAQNYITSGQFPPTGRGSDAASVATRTAITSKVGAIAASAGMDEPQLRQFFKANAASLAQQQKTFDAAQSNINTADRNVAELDKFLGKLPDTGSPLFNQPLRAFATKVQGDPNMGPIATYIASVQNEYGKIISSSNGAVALTDSARHEAQQLIDPNATVAQILGSIQALKTEGANRLLSVGDQIQQIQKRMQIGQGAAPPATTAATAAPAAPAGMMRVVGPNGQTGSMPVGNALPPGWKKQ